MGRFEYIKCFWRYTDDETPVLLYYEVDLAHERFAARAIEIFPDQSVHHVSQAGFDFVSEAPIPTVAEINRQQAFYAESVSKEEFECACQTKIYTGDIRFPK